jgi:hypothetical protein
MPESDSLYHRLFSHPRMVEEIVREFVPEALASGLDFSALQRVNPKFHTARRTAQHRESEQRQCTVVIHNRALRSQPSKRCASAAQVGQIRRCLCVRFDRTTGGDQMCKLDKWWHAPASVFPRTLKNPMLVPEPKRTHPAHFIDCEEEVNWQKLRLRRGQA